MKKWIALALLAGLTACSSNAPEEKPTPAETAATPAPAPPPTPEPPAAPEPPKAEPAPAPVNEAPKNAAKAAPAPAANKTSNLNPGLYAHFQTTMGNFTAELNEKEAPITTANFAGLASGTKEWTDPRTGQKQKKPFYNGLTFHRIIGKAKAPPDGFMIQGGDPLGNGTGGPGFTIKDEHNNLKHNKAGVLAMARTQLPDSAGSQFYITVTATPFLDGQSPPYVVFGQVIQGMDVIQKIGSVATDGDDKPLTPVVINKLTIERVK